MTVYRCRGSSYRPLPTVHCRPSTAHHALPTAHCRPSRDVALCDSFASRRSSCGPACGPMLTVSWSVVLNTGSQLTALDLLTRVARNLNVHMGDVWLRPWG